jgi:hypothetical protein
MSVTNSFQESFYSKLKKFSDECNTNLYVSNIPKNMNEHVCCRLTTALTAFSNSHLSSHLTKSVPAGSFVTLPAQAAASALLGKPPVLSHCSCTLLTISSFDSRDICDEVIKEFNNTPVSMPGGDEHLIQIRFSDTHEQKMLKQQTAAGRVFRAAEYEVGVAQARARDVHEPAAWSTPAMGTTGTIDPWPCSSFPVLHAEGWTHQER